MCARPLLALLVACLGCQQPIEPAPPLRVLSLNIANGAGDGFRTEAMRGRQRDFLRASGAHVAALQEVDVGVDRSGNVSTAAHVAGLSQCTFEVSSEGLAQCRDARATAVFGAGFRGDDLFHADASGVPSGILDVDESLNPRGVDRGADAYFGNAVVVLEPHEVTAAYVVALPEVEAATMPLALLAKIGAADALSETDRAALTEHNLGVRTRPGVEPRSVLVVRLREPRHGRTVLLATHLESSAGASLRAAQLEAVAQVARAERSHAADARLVVLGDFNMQPSEAAPQLTDAGFVLAAGASPASPDQIWVDAALTAQSASQLATEGASDHPYAPTVVLP